MTNKIEISRELAQKVDDLLYIMTGHDSYPRLVHKYGKEWWTPINEMRAEICTMLAAPVVERQDPLLLGNLYRVAEDQIEIEIVGDPHIKDGMEVYTSPPAPPLPDAAKAFAKGFNTLETVDGKYKIIMQFAERDDAWAAYTALSKLTASLAKPQ